MQWPEALALIERAQSFAEPAKAAFDGMTTTAAGEAATDLGELLTSLRQDKCIAQANAVLASLPTAGSLSEALAAGSVTSKTATTAVFDRLSKFRAGVFAPIPPPMVPVPCKPLHFDLAVNTLDFPDLTARMKMSRKSSAKKAKKPKQPKAAWGAQASAASRGAAPAPAPAPAAAPAPASSSGDGGQQQQQGSGGWMSWLTGK